MPNRIGRTWEIFTSSPFRVRAAGIGTKPKPKSTFQPAVAKEAMPQGGLPFGLTPQVTATEPQLKHSTVGVLESVFREDQRQEQEALQQTAQIKAEITSLRARLAALETELAAL